MSKLKVYKPQKYSPEGSVGWLSGNLSSY